jgi:hypothetical protein
MSLINISGEASLPRNSLNTQHDVYSVKFIARKRWFVAGTCDGFIHVYKYETRIMDCIKRFRGICRFYQIEEFLDTYYCPNLPSIN